MDKKESASSSGSDDGWDLLKDLDQLRRHQLRIRSEEKIDNIDPQTIDENLTWHPSDFWWDKAGSDFPPVIMHDNSPIEIDSASVESCSSKSSLEKQLMLNSSGGRPVHFVDDHYSSPNDHDTDSDIGVILQQSDEEDFETVPQGVIKDLKKAQHAVPPPRHNPNRKIVDRVLKVLLAFAAFLLVVQIDTVLIPFGFGEPARAYPDISDIPINDPNVMIKPPPIPLTTTTMDCPTEMFQKEIDRLSQQIAHLTNVMAVMQTVLNSTLMKLTLPGAMAAQRIPRKAITNAADSRGGLPSIEDTLTSFFVKDDGLDDSQEQNELESLTKRRRTREISQPDDANHDRKDWSSKPWRKEAVKQDEEKEVEWKPKARFAKREMELEMKKKSGKQYRLTHEEPKKDWKEEQEYRKKVVDWTEKRKLSRRDQRDSEHQSDWMFDRAQARADARECEEEPPTTDDNISSTAPENEDFEPDDCDTWFALPKFHVPFNLPWTGKKVRGQGGTGYQLEAWTKKWIRRLDKFSQKIKESVENIVSGRQ